VLCLSISLSIQLSTFHIDQSMRQLGTQADLLLEVLLSKYIFGKRPLLHAPGIKAIFDLPLAKIPSRQDVMHPRSIDRAKYTVVVTWMYQPYVYMPSDSRTS